MQPVPMVTADDVERIVRRDFPSDKHDAVMKMLNEYGTETWHREEVRVRIAILRLVEGRFDQLRSHVEMAKQDYRDVLAYSEYPNYMRTVPPSGQSAEAIEQHSINRDWQQYLVWLHKR